MIPQHYVLCSTLSMYGMIHCVEAVDFLQIRRMAEVFDEQKPAVGPAPQCGFCCCYFRKSRASLA